MDQSTIFVDGSNMVVLPPAQSAIPSLLQKAWCKLFITNLNYIQLYNYFEFEKMNKRNVFWMCRAIQRSNCHRKNGPNDGCRFPIYPHMIGFGIIEIFLSQIPNFSKLTGLSTVAAIMSFGYTSIGIGLSIVKIVKGKYWCLIY